MKKLVKSYAPFVIILLLVYMILPTIFIQNDFDTTYLYQLVFPSLTILFAVGYSWKHGLDFLFAIISPVLYLPSMLIYNRDDITGGLINLAIYLVCGILGSFIGDIVYSDEKKKKEKAMDGTVAIQMEQKKAEASEREEIEQNEISDLKKDIATYDVD